MMRIKVRPFVPAI